MNPKNDTRKKEILDFIIGYIDAHDVSPSIPKIAQQMGLSSSTVHKYLERLETEGSIMRHGRNQIVLGTMNGFINVPILGAIPCGSLTESYEDIEGYVKFPSSFLESGSYYLLRTYGDSMINAGIDDGDLVLIRQQEEADDGDIVVALADGGNTLKRLYRDYEHKQIILHPENDNMDDIIVKECYVQGVAVKIIKDIKKEADNYAI